MKEATRKLIMDLAAKTAGCKHEDFDIMGDCGGNYDDAYSMGLDDGEILLAQAILALEDE